MLIFSRMLKINYTQYEKTTADVQPFKTKLEYFNRQFLDSLMDIQYKEDVTQKEQHHG